MKKNSSAGKREGHDARQQKRTQGSPRQQTGLKRHLTPLKMGISLGVVIVGIALLLGPKLLDDGGTTLSSEKPGATTLLTAPPGTKVPINAVDPVTGNPITPTSPTKTHKGYVIAFCCDKSSGYTGWDRMAETDKDAFVRRYLK